MDRSPLSVGPDLTVEALVKDFIYGLNRKFIIVAEDGKAFGYIAPEQIRRVLHSQWRDTFVRTIAERFTHDTVVSPASSAMEALRKLQSNGIRHLAVLEGNALVGTVRDQFHELHHGAGGTLNSRESPASGGCAVRRLTSCRLRGRDPSDGSVLKGCAPAAALPNSAATRRRQIP